MYQKKGNYDLGIKDFKKAIEINPKNLSSYNGLGLIYEKKALYEKAINTYRNLILNATLPQDKNWVESAQGHIRELGGTL
ncbi:hypothetical protein SDC9_165494 [bioreactor metagenome]|uniref:Photosystem I assembly protein Ycf3 n=1 Tax=bioreactor metagenome TaxID=1076179 RepID=A0A645FWB0_9ZZZZ